MVLHLQKQVAGLFLDIVRQKPQIGKVEFHPQKARFRKEEKASPVLLPRSTPEKEGVSSRVLLRFLQEAQRHPTVNPHTILVLRNGKVIADCSYAPYRSDVWHVTHSMCKGITALAIGMLIHEGKLSLEEKLCDIFPGKLTPLGNPLSFWRFKTITVRHLLTMTSGVTFNESGAVVAEDWLKGFFEAPVRFDPGTEFAYNSMNSYVLSAIVKERTGQGLVQFLRPRLFAPLHMERVHWETCPKGIEKGGWGLYLCPEDMAKIGQLLLQDGIWNGRRLVPRGFLEEMTKKQVDTPPEMGEQGYGFQTWMGKRPASYLLNGILGQNIIVLPDAGMVVVTTGGNDSLFKTSPIVSLVEKYFEGKGFSPGPSLPADRRGWKALRGFQRQARNLQGTFQERKRRRQGLPAECRLLNGKEYRFSPGGARLLPLFTQLMQNNYSTGVDFLKFSLNAEGFFLTVGEGTERNKIGMGFGDAPVYSNVTVNGESYLVAASARFVRDEDENIVLKIRLPFIEHSNGRRMKVFFFRDGSVELQMAEMPDAEELLKDTGLFFRKSAPFWMNRLVARNDADIFAYTLQRTLKPKIRGRLVRFLPG